jgi:methylmalonyl-CoA epimerase
VHHICFEVDDVDKELQSMAAKGVELIDKKGRPGLAGKIGFLHPKSAKGVLIELAQKV